jgi:hypothetical protein
MSGIMEEAAKLMHISLCVELRKKVIATPDTPPKEIPEVVKIMDAIDVIEELYPSTKYRGDST